MCDVLSNHHSGQKNITLCIPRISTNITKKQLYYVFGKLNWGVVTNIVFVNTSKKKKDSFNKKTCANKSSKWGFKSESTFNDSSLNWRDQNSSHDDVSVISNIEYNCVFIYLNWLHNENVNIIKNKFMNGDCIKIIYNEFEFWKLYAKKT